MSTETTNAITLTFDQYVAIERLRHSSPELLSSTTNLIIEVPEQQFGLYVRVSFVAGWGGKARYDLDLYGNSEPVNSLGESSISLDAVELEKP